MILLKDYGPEIFGQEVDKLNEEKTNSNDEEKTTSNDEEKTTSNDEEDFNPFT